VPVPLDDAAAPIRDRLALKRQQLDVLDPEALDMAVGILFTLHGELSGELAQLAGDRTARYRRGQLLGEHGLPIEDLCYLHRYRPASVARALRWLTTEPEEAPRQASLATSGAQLNERVTAFVNDLLRALDDGQLTLAEAASLDRDLDGMDRLVRDARAALIRRRP
jgi:hypothetical protein